MRYTYMYTHMDTRIHTLRHALLQLFISIGQLYSATQRFRYSQVGHNQQFDNVSDCGPDVLHWHRLPQRITYRTSAAIVV